MGGGSSPKGEAWPQNAVHPHPPSAQKFLKPSSVTKVTQKLTKDQKTREGCGCFRGLFGGSPGKLRESPGEIAGNFFLNREMLQILGFRASGKANLPGTLGRDCQNLVPTFRAGCFLKSTVPAFSSFSEKKK